jgi:pilus assembly protein CpaD
MAASDRKDSKIMQRSTKIGVAISLGLAASGCASTSEPLSATNNPSLYSVHQPVVQRTDYVIDLPTSGDELATAERQRLAAWFESIGLGYGDRVFVDEPEGYGSPGARRDIADVARAYGLFLAEGAPVLDGQVQPGTVRVVASRASISDGRQRPKGQQDHAAFD